ncbi:MAG TPA: SDR family oxidoreductase [Acidimicrobiales bacterium]|nr:SDR family oxidoreductase [Acidimicrobiales bacterium]
MIGRLQDRVAVVTGAASGIGEGIASRFAEEGAHVVVADVDSTGGERVAKAVDGIFVDCDVSREADLARAVDTAVTEFGGLHCFVGNAGFGGVMGPITDLDEEGFDRTVAVLLKGVAFGMKHACRVMQGQGGGSIISTSSVAGLMGGMGPHVYSACKAGVIGITRSVALEQGPFGIRVNCINPGGIATPIFTRGLGVQDDAETSELIMQVVSGGVASGTPLGRIGTPADIAAAAVWLASDDSSYVTGQTIVVDGGLISTKPLLGEQLRDLATEAGGLE